MKYADISKLFESEQLDELNQDTLKSYSKKAAKDNRERFDKLRYDDKHPNPNTLNKDNAETSTEKKYINRQTGGARAWDRLYGKKSNQPKHTTPSANKYELGGYDPKSNRSYSESLEDCSIDEILEFMVSEEFEQLDEISKDTLRSYIKRAEFDRDLNKDTAKITPSDTRRASYLAVAAQREGGIKKASAKLNSEGEEIQLDELSLDEIVEFIQTEEYMQLDELSKKTLGSYIKKASSQEFTRGRISAKGDVETMVRQANKSDKRIDGIKKAVNKLTKEDINPTHEISYTEKHDILGTIVKSFQVNESVLDEKLEELSHVYGVSNVKVKEL